jgi:hypothetical protein
MKIEEIEKEWSEDLKLDRTILDQQSLDIPFLHHKYYQIYIREKLILEKQELDFSSFKKLKWEYYTGKLDKETLKINNWDQFDLTILRADVEKYIDADNEIIEKRLKMSAQREKVRYLEEIIKSIQNRSFYIKNCIEYLKFTQGSS